MKCSVIPVFLFIFMCPPVHAQGIDLDCDVLAEQLIQRLSDEALLSTNADVRQRARIIGLELCSGAEVSAQQQHEVGKQKAIERSFWEKRPENPGHRRLRKH